MLSRLAPFSLCAFGTVVLYFGLPSSDATPPLAEAAETADKPATIPAPALPPPARTVALNGHNFTLPDGFTVELAAGSPLVERPIHAAFDEKGRLYVTDSSGSNDKTAEQVKSKPHRIVRLEDTDGDGKFDKGTVYVKNISLPEGAMWLYGSLYVAAPPQIWKFTDTDGDGVADKEEIWFDGKTVLGCANDLHGPFLGPDGWIYWTKGAFAKQEYTLANGKKWSTRASHVFRARPDGTGLEAVMSGGMDNPVGLTFTPTGEIVLGCTFLQHPADGKRDGLIHAVYGGVYGKDHDPIHEHPWTSPHLMPVMTHLGPAAPSGIHRYESDQFGKEYTDNVFVSQFNLRKVSRHVLVPDGSTFRTIDSDFLVSDNRDFHPTDVVEDADGSLLVLDTGGWYKLCCPTSQLAQADVKGAIYRVRKVGAHGVEDKWGQGGKRPTIEREDLDDPRPFVRRRLIESLAKRGWKSFEFLAAMKLDPAQRLSLVWVATQNDSKLARDIVRGYVRDDDDKVRQAALHSAILWRDRYICTSSLQLLRHPDLTTRRLAAQASGRIGNAQASPYLFSAVADSNDDRVLDHSLTYALIEIGSAKNTAGGLSDLSPRVRRAALTALDQMPGGKLDAKHVLAELDSKDAALKETAWWIVGRHPEWGGLLAGCFADQLKAADALAPAGRGELVERLVKFAKNEAVQKALADTVRDGSKAGGLLALRAMAKAPLKTMPEAWRKALLDAAAKLDDLEALRAAYGLLRALPVAEGDAKAFVAALPAAALWAGGAVPVEFRLAPLSAVKPGAALDEPTVAFLLACVRRDEPAAVRSEAADALARAGLTPAQLARLAAHFKALGPLEFAKLLPAFAASADAGAGRALVTGLSDDAVRRSVRLEQVEPILAKYPPEVRAEAEGLYALMAGDRKEERAKLDRLMTELKPGDVRRGQAVFHSAKAACASCHKIGYVGGTVGPELRGIGKVRTERDLMEAIVFPSASFVRSYEPYRVTTADGKAHNGVLKKDAPDEVVLAVAADREVRIPRADIEEMAPSTVSLMPSGLDQQLSSQDLADLIAFLKANR